MGQSALGMLIKSENKAAVATAMMMFALGKNIAAVYTMGIGSSGQCEVDQCDPVK